MRLVFPHASTDEIDTLLRRSFQSLARFVVDSLRFDRLPAEWYKKHFSAPFNARYHELRAAKPGLGILIVGGHLGSVELQAAAMPFLGRKFSFVTRTFKSEKLEAWWNIRRQSTGNRTIPRKEAVAAMLADIRAGIDVGILIDQNITTRHAIFVDWFGRPAATTFAAAKVAIETGATIILSAISHIGSDNYRLNEQVCDISSITEDTSLTTEEKIIQATKLMASDYQKMILAQPDEWFWLHRRWKTAQLGVDENFYDDC